MRREEYPNIPFLMGEKKPYSFCEMVSLQSQQPTLFSSSNDYPFMSYIIKEIRH